MGREVSLDENQKQIVSAIEGALEQGGWNPPSLAELSRSLPHPVESVRDLFFFLLEQGKLVRITESLILPAPRVDKMVERLRKRFPDGSAFSVADFKDLLGVSRKFAIPYLEYLDRNRITQRHGDQRILI